MERNTKIFISAVVGGVLALGYRSYNKKKMLIAGAGTSGNAEERSAEESSNEPVMGGGGGGSIGSAPVSTDGSTTKAPTTNTPVLTREPNLEQVPLTQLGTAPIMQTRPAVLTAPVSVVQAKPIITATATREIVAVSRFSGFQGGSNHVEVGSQLNDL